MYLHALATAVPSASFTQSQCWDIVSASPTARQRLKRRSMLILQTILRGDSGIATRQFAMPNIEEVFELTPDQLNESFRSVGPALAGEALDRALLQAGIMPDEVDALLICTCTGYLCPGLTSYVAEQRGMRPDVFLQDLVGLGCGAAIPTLRAAEAVLAARPEAVVACIAVEICSAAFYLDDDPGVLISACLFSDGAAATIWRSHPGPTGIRCHGFNTLHRPEDRDKLRFEMREGKLRNRLHRTVPELAAGAVTALLAAEGGVSFSRILSHPGGRDVLDALEAALPGHSLAASREVLRRYANMSSPSILFVLEEALRHDRPGPDTPWWMVSFGAGFSAHSCRISATNGNPKS